MGLASIIVATAFATSSFAQEARPNPRYEIMWRMRELDRAWLGVAGVEGRAKTLVHLDQVARRLHLYDIVSAVREIDAARHELNTSWFDDAVACVPESRFLDEQTTSLEVRLSCFYGNCFGCDCGLSGALNGRDLSGHDESAAIPSDGDSRACSFEFSRVASGDHPLELLLINADMEVGRRGMTLSFVEHRDARLSELDKAIAALPDKAPRLERATLGALNTLLKSLAAGSTEETDYPAARLLAEAEQVVAAAAKGEHWYGPTKTGQFWLALSTNDKQTTRARVLAPQGIECDKPTALVIALHGEGFSENTFFDCYGDGQVVKLCEERNWLLVAPRLDASGNAPLSAIVDAMAAIYPVDRARVFLVGHSNGADLALDAVTQSPQLFQALAVLATSHEVKAAQALEELPLFIAAGDHDFALSYSAQLDEELRAAGSKVATFKIYPNCEHLMVVADALPDVFAWFSSLAH